MFAVRYVYLLALSAWLGAMIALGAVVAPAIFRVLEAHDPVQGRSLAGVAFGTILQSFYYVAYGAGALLLACLAAMALLTRPRGVGLRALIVAGMLGMSLYAGLVVGPRVERLQREIGVAVQSLPASDARRIEFDRLHGLSTTLMGFTVGGCLVLLGWEARDTR